MIATSLFLSSLLSACGGTKSEEAKTISVDGSSTVFPITNLMAENYNASTSKPVTVEVGFSGSIGGFQKFCKGETDINNSSVPIPQRFMEKKKIYNVRTYYLEEWVFPTAA